MSAWLFAPAHLPRLTAKAHQRGAEVVVLDLEDAVPAERKAEARAALADVVAGLVGVRVVVRVNAGLQDLVPDLEAALLAGVEGVMLPKARDPAVIRLVAEHLDTREVAIGLAPGSVGLVALIESAEGLMNAAAIARAPRVSALAFGPEDFSTEVGCQPDPRALTLPAQQLVWAARAAGVQAIGLPDSLAVIDDTDRFEAAVTLGRDLGLDGVLCIHPAQVQVVNRVYQPSAEALAQARRLVAAAQTGAFRHEGQMVDAPVVARALRLLRRNPDRTEPA